MSLDSNDTKIHNILSLVKLGSLIIISIVFIKNSVSDQDLIFINFNITISFMIKLFIALILSVTYYIWSYVIIKRIKIKNNNLLYIIESLVFLIFFMWFIWITGKNYSPYKVIFLFIIIPVSIQFGFKYGIIASNIASLFMLIMDLLLEPNQLLNINFENDIIISSIFIVISWLLSHYVKIQQEYAAQLEYKANTDVLTGLKNHRFFYDQLEGLFLDSKNIDKLSLIYFDIDYFKDYNDMFGHLRGDIVLKSIGSKLKEILRDDNVIVARYGGDEFAIIVQNKTKEQVYEIGERIRFTIEKMYFEGQEHLTSKNLTISLGIAIYDENTNGYVDLIKQADDALYKAKFTNKNKVEVFGSVSNIMRLTFQGEDSDAMPSILTLISVINAKDKYTYGHVERVVRYVQLLADKLNLSDEDKHTLIYGAYIHDIGKLNIPEYVLNKKMPLSDEEWKLIKKHPTIGVELISKVDSISKVVPLVKHHHERFDGRGYPDGLMGENIPYLARILTVADSFDAMTFNRTYKRAMSYKEAIVELRKCSSTQFDPAIAEVFIEVIKELDREKTNNEH